MKALTFSLALLAATTAAHANPWEPQMDLLSAGAAASVVVFHSCIGATDHAIQAAAQRLRQAALNTSDPESAYRYASDSFELKIKAMWQSTDGECHSMNRLRSIASTTGFSLPK